MAPPCGFSSRTASRPTTVRRTIALLRIAYRHRKIGTTVMRIHSLSIGAAPPNTRRSLPVVLCGSGRCCTGPCDLVGSALGDVWFTWQRAEKAMTLVVLDSNDDRAHALRVTSSLPTGRGSTVREPAGHPARGFCSQLTSGTDLSGTAAFRPPGAGLTRGVQQATGLATALQSPRHFAQSRPPQSPIRQNRET